MNYASSIVLSISFLILMLIYLLFFRIVGTSKKYKDETHPVNHNRLRNPGESSSQKVVKYNNSLAANLFFVISLFSSGTIISIESVHDLSFLSLSVPFIDIMAMYFLTFRIPKLLTVIENAKLTRDAEISVVQYAFEIANGSFYYLLNDLFLENNKTISSVLIHSSGLYIITAFGIKNITINDKRYIAKIKGDTIIINGEERGDIIKETKENAFFVSEITEGSCSKKIPVFPVFALPGWFLTGNSNKNNFLYNPSHKNTNINFFGKEVLNEEEMKNIFNLLKVRSMI